MSLDVMFSNISDDYRTPGKFFQKLSAKVGGFSFDMAASRKNTLAPNYFGLDHENPDYRDSLCVDWVSVAQQLGVVPKGYLNPPYSMCKEFVEKSEQQRQRGFFSSLLIPVRTDTAWYHDVIWDENRQRPRSGHGLDFVRRRLQFSLDVTEPMRQAVRKEYAAAIRPKSDEDEQRLEKVISKAVGLPVLIVRAILADEPEVVASAPFPSMVVHFYPEIRR